MSLPFLGSPHSALLSSFAWLGLLSPFSCLCGIVVIVIMVHNFTRTIALDISGFPASSNRNIVASAIANRFLSLKVSAVQLVGNIARVLFADTASKDLVMRMETVYIGDDACPVKGGGPHPQKVLVHNYPFEASTDSLSIAMRRYGEVKDISYCHWLHMHDICDGVRLVTMIRTEPIPHNLNVDGFRIKVSYYGQAVECDVCNEHGHVARNCPLRGKCLWCHQSGHLYRDCTNPGGGESTVHVSTDGALPNDPPVPNASCVSDGQASEGVPSGQPSEPMFADSQPLFSADEQCYNEVNDSSNDSEMENIVNDKPSDSHAEIQSEVNESSCSIVSKSCESQLQSEVNESSGMSINNSCESPIQIEVNESSGWGINSDTQIESFSSPSEHRSWAEIAGAPPSSVEDLSAVQLSSWDSGLIKDVMDLDHDPGKSSVTNIGSSRGKAKPGFSGGLDQRKKDRSTPGVANPSIRRNRPLHIPEGALKAAVASLHVPR